MKVNDYELIRALADYRSMRIAATKLYLSQPAISQRLKHIEALWDTTLFIRSAKELTLTPEGEKVVAYAREHLEREENLRQSLKSTGVSGTLSLAVSTVVSQYTLPSLLQAYLREYPDVKIELTTGLSQDIRSAKNVHIKLLRGEKPAEQFVQALEPDPLYLMEQRHTSSRANSQVLIQFKSDASYQAAIDEWLMANERFPEQTIVVDQIETSKQLVLHGIGMAVLPESSLKGFHESEYSRTPLLLDNKPLTRPTWVSCTKGAEHLPQVVAFLELLDVSFPLSQNS
ncbi:LysR family transcriptional regulator [Paenalkalicoccus suaedae]|uniref:LysR family transcriptional regulator n=1 Tax=Paenalkalicoccus suaedae TaxID=2592382 RepID=A0A859FAS4_9BACI|nr:LysR family transcriptional regulator [Paenalkalicoccus suaedae]QKS70067.1 LysR family transcriptional regulator [Paenalkalicoccus suaedae]